MRPHKKIFYDLCPFETLFIPRLLWRQKVNKLNLNKSELGNFQHDYFSWYVIDKEVGEITMAKTEEVWDIFTNVLNARVERFEDKNSLSQFLVKIPGLLKKFSSTIISKKSDSAQVCKLWYWYYYLSI